MNGTISVPAGTWPIDKTLYLNQLNPSIGQTLVVNLSGAGQSQTIIEAAPGYEAIPLVMAGEYLQEPAQNGAIVDINALHHPRVSGIGIYDAGVTGARYGLRTKSTATGTLNNRGFWAAGNTYAVNDEVSDGTNTYVCTTAHTATDSSPEVDKPYYGINWRNFWRQTNACASGYFVDSPLTIGPLDTANPGQPSYLQNSDQFTLDVCVENNESVNMEGQVCIDTSGDLGSSWKGTIWSLLSDGNYLYFTINVPSGIPNEGDTGTVIQANLGNAPGPGVHRITVQADFRDPQRQLAAWVDGKQVGITVNGVTAASYQYPEGTRLENYQTGAFQLGTNERGVPGIVDQDWTYCGLCLSNAVRYQVGNIGDAQAYIGGGAPTDTQRYFTNDANTIAYLPLDDAPPADTDYLNSAWKLVKVQHGYASTPAGDTPHYGYGWWLQPESFYQPGPVVHDLTLLNSDQTYGAPFNMYLDYGADIQNVTLDGGFNNLDHWLEGSNNYVMRLRNVTLQNAANSGIYSTGQTQFLGNGITVLNGGRYPLYLRMCGADFSNLTLSAGPYTQYLMYAPSDQCQSFVFNNVTVLADTADNTPAQGVFNIGLAMYGMCGPNSFYLNGCTAYHLPAGITFLALPNSTTDWEYPEGHLTVEHVDFSVDNGGTLASFISCTAPVWRGRIYGCTAALNQYVSTWLDTGKWVLPWFTSGNYGYQIDDVVSHNGTQYRCIMNQSDFVYTGDIVRHEPGVGSDWTNYWQVYPTANLVFIHPDFTALPSSGTWVEGCHIVQIPSNPNGTTEYRCVQSGNAGDPNPAHHPIWAPVITTPPTVTLTGPGAGSYLPGCTLTLTATATTATSHITHVDFYQGNTLLGTGTLLNGVYSCTWSNVPAGSYSLTANAHDTNAAWTVSTAVNISVNAANTVAAPAFTPGAGTYSAAQNVTIGTITGGATIRYTTDGSTPSETAGTVYSSAVTITADTTLQAIAYENGMSDSAISTANYFIQCAAPTYTPAAGTYTAAQAVTISTTTSGATIRYTTNGNVPTETTGTVYSSAVAITATSTLQAIAYATGMANSGVTSAVYTLNIPCAAPTFTPAAGTYTSVQSVTISTTTGGATIRYTTDGSTPSETVGTVYSSPVTISAATTLNAIAYMSGLPDSPVVSKVYTIILIPTNGLRVWFAADSISNADLNGTTVATWPDLSGNGFNATQTNASYQPALVANSLNGKPVVRFAASTSNNTYQYLTTAYTEQLNNLSAIIVYRDDGYAQFAEKLIDKDSSSAPTGFFMGRNSFTANQWGGNVMLWTSVVSATLTDGAPHVLAGVRSGTTSGASTFTVYGDGQAVAPETAAGGPTDASPLGIGWPNQAWVNGSKYNAYLNGDIAEILVYDVALSAGDLQTVETYLVNKYALTGATICAAPSFTPAAGSYSSTQTVTIGTATGGATIRYTTDGSTPTEANGTVYSTAVNISATTTLQALAYKAGMADSSVTSGVYTIGSSSLPATGMLLWLKADAITGLSNGGSVNNWNDASGNGYNAVFTQVNGQGVAPLYETNVYNGLPVVRFGGNSLLQVNALPLGTYTIATVFKTNASQQIIYEHSDNLLGNTNGSFLYTSTNSSVSVKRGGIQTGKDIVETNAASWAANPGVPLLTVDEFGGTDASEQLFINGSQQWLHELYTGNLNTAAASTQHFNIGERAQYGGLQFIGDLAEIVVYDHVLSNADYTTLTNALMSKYALANAPTTTLTAPTNGAQYTAPASIMLAATASVNGGTISKVEFYNGNTLLGTATGSPYSLTWTNVAAGSYTVTAVAYSNYTLTTPTASSTITVTGAAQCAAPTFTPAAGSYSSAQSVTISTTTGGAGINYTTNGTTPSSSVGTTYSTPVSIGSTCTLQAIAYENGYTPSSVSSGVYTINSGPVTTIWVDDALPGGATGYGENGDTWNWVSGNPSPYSGTLAWQSNNVGGTHQVYFKGATTTLTVGANDTLFCFVYLNAGSTPSEVMLQWTVDGSNWYRAYWGANNISYGTATYIGALPAAGQWVCFSVPASTLGVGGLTLTGMAYSLCDGQATFDYAGKSSAGAPCAAPTFTPAAGSYSSAQSVTITTTTGGAGIRYTTNGTSPSETVGTVYNSPVSITATTTLQAIAYETGYADSAVASGIFTITCATPTFTPAAGSYNSAQTVTIGTTTGGRPSAIPRTALRRVRLSARYTATR